MMKLPYSLLSLVAELYSAQRYAGQMQLPNFGVRAQNAIASARVLIVGAGGLGCPAITYLAAAGIGTLGVVDFDIVEVSNLHRQTLFNMSHIGLNKATVVESVVGKWYPDTRVDACPVTLEVGNAIQVLDSYDMIVDATDNARTKLMLSDACMILDKPLVYGAVYRYEGQVSVFTKRGASYRHYFPHESGHSEPRSCAVDGVLGVVPGIVGSMQASEVLKLITGIGEPLESKMLYYNFLTNTQYIAEMPEQARQSTGPTTKEEFKLTNYQQLNTCCNSGVTEISAQQAGELVANSAAIVVDVRELSEQPRILFDRLIEMPMSDIVSPIGRLLPYRQIVFVCASGKRSRACAEMVLRADSTKDIYSVADGALELIKCLPRNIAEVQSA